MNKKIFIDNIKAANKEIPCDLVVKNISVVDVFQCSSFICDVAIKNGFIVGLGDYSGDIEIDGTGKFICPGLIDSHAHIESSMLTPNEYYKTALLHGVTSLIADPHEIANILGQAGIKFMIDSAQNIPFDFYFMLPSCVPSTPFENSGAVLNSSDLKDFYSNSKVLGLAEVMDYPSVSNCNDDMINKLYDAISNNSIIDGHGAGLNTHSVNVYSTANIKTDHECATYEQLVDRVRRGIYVLMREGTVAKNLNDLIKGASIFNSRRLCLCTDDKHIDDLAENGSIDTSIKMCIEGGLAPEIAIQMATLNAAECYNLKNKGAIAPSYIADFIILDNLEEFKINSVYKNGKLVVSNNILITDIEDSNLCPNLSNSINLPTLTKDILKIDVKNKSTLNVIELIPNKLESNHLRLDISKLNFNDEFVSSTTNDNLLKIAVIERHKNTGNVGLGVLKGLNIKSGAIATTIAHDSHNLIVCGTNDSDMLFAIQELKNINGGIIIVKDGKVLASVSLEIGGIITARKSNDVISDLNKLHDALKIIAPDINFNPFLTLSFLSLPVIPDIKITDKGLFDVKNFNFIDVCE
ncbi:MULTISPECIES: adenine deaminase [unclassified Clostridium]|uniref:adenine deaminase n=1 Tax=unclassified Clostridium TaxID=2614128 RepID=UPI00189935D8|nr:MULTISPECIES: adenine deaminase [unclassified Clostridium]MBP3917332.1 adenine deaminase [Clostridium sp.]MEE0932869.1 adenine deaminase [Clostridium sp.]